MANQNDIGGLERGGFHAKTSRANVAVGPQTGWETSLDVNGSDYMPSLF